VLELSNVGKLYGSLRVLDGVSFRAHRGEVVGIVGPNGAGKTTLLRCIADGRERSTGEIVINGRRSDGLPPQACVALGVSRKFQTPNVFDALSVVDCLRVARSYRTPTSPWRRSPTVELPDAALHAVRVSGLLSALDTPAAHLSHGARQALELAMVLALEPTVLLLDEPTAGLSPAETGLMTRTIQKLDPGIAILLIEHSMDVVFDIVTTVTVLHLGRTFAEGTPAEVRDDPRVQEIYFGAGEMARC
jgi:branched-chain amino acid transport system permease protein